MPTVALRCSASPECVAQTRMVPSRDTVAYESRVGRRMMRVTRSLQKGH